MSLVVVAGAGGATSCSLLDNHQSPATGQVRPLALNGVGGWLYNERREPISVTLYAGGAVHVVAPGGALEIPGQGGPTPPWHVAISVSDGRLIAEQDRGPGAPSITVTEDGIGAQEQDEADEQPADPRGDVQDGEDGR